MARTRGQKLEETVAILTLGVGLLALFFEVENWWVVFVVGWFVLTPLAEVFLDDEPAEESLASDDETTHGRADEAVEADTADALDTLRDRYARGELTELEFERKVERLLETETVETAREQVGGGGSRGGTPGKDAEPGREVEREPDR